MTKEIFTAIVVSGTLGAVMGILIQYHNDSRHIKAIKDAYEEIIDSYKKMLASHDNEWQALIRGMSNDYQVRLAQALKKPEKRVDPCVAEFYDLTAPVPEGWVELNFPNGGKEGRS